MPQSSAIVAFIGLAFAVFIIQRGELPIYMGLLLGNTASGAAPQAPAQAQSSANGVSLNSALSSLGSAAELLALA